MMNKDFGSSRDTWSVSKITQELLGKREEMKQISALSYRDDSSASHLIFSVLCLTVMKHRSKASPSPVRRLHCYVVPVEKKHAAWLYFSNINGQSYNTSTYCGSGYCLKPWRHNSAQWQRWSSPQSHPVLPTGFVCSLDTADNLPVLKYVEFQTDSYQI